MADDRPAAQPAVEPAAGLAHLWAGWRSTAWSATPSGMAPVKEPGCVMCRIASTPAPDAERLVLFQDAHVIVLMNLYPYTSGHIMVCPMSHVGSIGELSDTDADALWQTVRHADGAVRRTFHPDGVNIGINQGQAAGASIPDHLHVHVVPRWTADTNFMTAVADTRVMIETVHRSYERLSSEW